LPRRSHLLARNQAIQFDGFSLEAVYADHGADEPDAIGIVLESEGTRIYHTGDTCYCPEKMERVIQIRPAVILPCINGTFGNLNAIEAAKLAADVGARVAIPCHFWMFPGQNLLAEGMPSAFLDACKKWAPSVTPAVLSVGEPYLFHKTF
jgi:L-ascorbate 6-phosphate lactonase